jgi:hypothetical protein
MLHSQIRIWVWHCDHSYQAPSTATHWSSEYNSLPTPSHEPWFDPDLGMHHPILQGSWLANQYQGYKYAYNRDWATADRREVGDLSLNTSRSDEWQSNRWNNNQSQTEGQHLRLTNKRAHWMKNSLQWEGHEQRRQSLWRRHASG